MTKQSEPCATCKSVGFAPSVLGASRCAFCDGTEGGNPPAQYVVGFGIDRKTLAARTPHNPRSPATVTLILKLKGPEYVRGYWNGVGGKVEPGEAPEWAMAREAVEEASMYPVGGTAWRQFHKECFNDHVLHFFVADICAPDTQQMEQEPLAHFWLEYGTGVMTPTVALADPNLAYLVPMAYHRLTHPEQFPIGDF